MITTSIWESLSLTTPVDCIYCIIRSLCIAVILRQLIMVWSFIARTIRGPCAKRVKSQVHSNNIPLIREAIIRNGDSLGMSVEEITQIPIITVTKTIEDCCAICLQPMQEGERVRVLPSCSHSFHIHCIDKWLDIRSNCPLCKKEERSHHPVAYHIPQNADPQTLSTSESDQYQEEYRIFIALSTLFVLLLLVAVYVLFGAATVFPCSLSLAFAILWHVFNDRLFK